ncbi:transposase [Cellulosilyticum ruminicola]|uniref:transposase n=1 Tax=Cellulosilyticum ruminicola TaxID=425254 RepID=UPI0009F92FBD
MQTLYSTISHSITAFDITSGVTHDTNTLPTIFNKLTDEIATKRIKKAIIQNNVEDINAHKRQLLHWNLMITNISKKILNTSIITELYRIRWQIELLF